MIKHKLAASRSSEYKRDGWLCTMVNTSWNMQIGAGRMMLNALEFNNHRSVRDKSPFGRMKIESRSLSLSLSLAVSNQRELSLI